MSAQDRIPFYGGRLNEEVSKGLTHLKKANLADQKKAIQAAVSILKSDSLKETGEEENTSFALLCSTVLSLYRSAIRLPNLKPAFLKEDLNALQLPNDFITEFTKAVGEWKEEKSIWIGPKGVERVQWRVDVTISSSALNRVLKPVVVLRLTLSDGSIHTLELTQTQFHNLRYSVSLVLKEMDNIHQKNIFKIKD